MLDSLKSLQKRDVGKQRKAEVAKRPETPAQEVPPLHPELLEIVRKLETAPHAKELEDNPVPVSGASCDGILKHFRKRRSKYIFLIRVYALSS